MTLLIKKALVTVIAIIVGLLGVFSTAQAAEPIYSLSVSGEATIKESDGYARIFLITQNDKYLVHEEMGPFDTGTISFDDRCYETCILDGVSPEEIEVKLQGATINLANVSYLENKNALKDEYLEKGLEEARQELIRQQREERNCKESLGQEYWCGSYEGWEEECQGRGEAVSVKSNEYCLRNNEEHSYCVTCATGPNCQADHTDAADGKCEQECDASSECDEKEPGWTKGGTNKCEWCTDSCQYDSEMGKPLSHHTVEGTCRYDCSINCKPGGWKRENCTVDENKPCADPECTNSGWDGSECETPSADFSYSPTNPKVSDTITFTDESSDPDGSIDSYNWEFGDDNTSTAQNPKHSYDSPGSYFVTLTVTDEDGNTGYTNDMVEVSSTSEKCAQVNERCFDLDCCSGLKCKSDYYDLSEEYQEVCCEPQQCLLDSQCFPNNHTFSSQSTLDIKCEDGEWVETEEKSITVTSPNGGESWKQGTTHEITWESQNVEEVLIELVNDNNEGWHLTYDVPASQGSYSWTVPKEREAGNYKIKVIGQGNATGTEGSSDDYFTLKGIEDPGECTDFNLSKTSITEGDSIEVSVAGEDNNGMNNAYYQYRDPGGNWHDGSYNCEGNSTCENVWEKVTLSEPGNYEFYGGIRGLKADGSVEDGSYCNNKEPITVSVKGEDPAKCTDFNLSATSISKNESVDVTVKGQDDNGVDNVYHTYYDPNQEDWIRNPDYCEGASTCENTWGVTFGKTGSYDFYGAVRGTKVDSEETEEEAAWCNDKNAITIEVKEACTDQCSSGKRRCEGAIVQECKDENKDGCTEWVDVRACKSGGSCGCSEGSCVGPWDWGTSKKNGSWDRDCDGSVTKRYTDTTSNTCLVGLPNPCPPGWASTVPSCGTEDKWVGGNGLCVWVYCEYDDWSYRTQECK